MTEPGLDAALAEYLDRPRTEGAAEWQRRRAGRRSITENDVRLDYAPIIFPPTAQCRHAALVVCGAMADEVDPVAEARVILEALALPTIIKHGGDGRTMKTQGRHARRSEPLPIGYGDEDYGRPDARVTRKRKRSLDGEVQALRSHDSGGFLDGGPHV